MTTKNKLVTPQSESILDQMKYEIAQEFGVQLSADSSARDNGSVGGEITRRLIRMAQDQLR
jgi:small acid-soluble spore protein B (major beta-type SASP)